MRQPIDRDTLREIVRELVKADPEDALFSYLSTMDWPVIPPRGPSSYAKNCDLP